MRNRDEGCRVRPTCQSLGFRISEKLGSIPFPRSPLGKMNFVQMQFVHWDAAEEDAVVCLVHEVEMNMKQMNLRCV